MEILELKGKSLIICGIVRDAANGLKRNIPVISDLCSYFGDYRIAIYENDSKDRTKDILSEWQRSDPKRIHVVTDKLGEGNSIPTEKEVRGNPFFSMKRIGKMAALRNKYIDYIIKEGWDADYMVVVDMDVWSISLDGILSSFTSNMKWDAVTAFGYSTSPKLKRRYHDTYALTEYGADNVPQTEQMIKSLAEKYASLAASDEWIRVFSAFGGLAIYRYECVRGLHYQVLPNEDAMVEVRCEHYSIYKQMASQGDMNVYINPRMKIKYQALSWKIIWRSLKRKLCL